MSCYLKCDYRGLRILMAAMSNLRYTEAMVDGILIPQQEFDALMDQLGSELGAEMRRRGLGNPTNPEALSAEEIRRQTATHIHGVPVYTGPERREFVIRSAAEAQNLHDAHMEGSVWFAKDKNNTEYVWDYNMKVWIPHAGTGE